MRLQTMNDIASSPVPESGRFAAARKVLEDAIASRAFPGCAFGVLAGGEVLLNGALGRFTYEDDALPVAPETVFDVASLTKVLATTAMAMLLHARGLLDLEMPAGEVLPGFVTGPQAGDRARMVTLRHLLAHSSGLPGYVELFRTAATPEALLQACLGLPLEAEPGARAEYSDPGFILLGKALEAIAGEPLDRWTRREIFDPLGMKATGFCPPAELRNNIPPTEVDASFRRALIQGEVQDENAWVLQGVSGHAGVFSNVPEILRFAYAVLGAGSSIGPGLFDAATVERFAQRQPPASSSRAIGWDTPSENSSSGKYFSRNSIGHLGYSGCSLWIDRDSELAVVLLTNRTWPDRSCQLIRQVRPAFHDALREALKS